MSPDESGQHVPSEEDRSARNGQVPAPAVRRLSLYLRELEGILKQDGQTISSKQLGETLGLTDAQVRKDLAYFGQFGHPGIGYPVDELIVRIRGILGTDRTWNALLVGAGNLGRALVRYRGFVKKGFRIVAVFDNNPAKVGERVGMPPELEILPLDKLKQVIAERDIRMAIIAVPAEVAQQLVDRLVAVGIKGILNFAPAALSVPEGVWLDSVDMAIHLEQLAFHLSAGPAAKGK